MTYFHMINWCLPVLCAVFLWHLGASSETHNTLRLGKPKGETPCRDFYAKEIVCNKNITEILYDVPFFYVNLCSMGRYF